MFVLRAFVNERLTTAVEEILGAVEHTVADYQNEVSRLEKEVGCLRQQLDTLQPVIKIPRADIQQVTVQVSEEKIAPEWHHCQQGIQPNNPSLDWRDPEPIPSKEELKDIETTEQQVDPEPTCIKEEEEHLNISEGLEGHDVMQHAQHPDPDFYPALSPDCATPPRGSNGKFSVARKGPRSESNTKKSRRTQLKEVKPTEVRCRYDPIHHRAYHHCRTCGKFYLTASALKKHIRVHTQDAQPLCGLCEQQFESREHLIDHLSTHIGAKYCHICGQCFDKDQDLNGHIGGHTGEKPFKCFICVKSFVRKENLAQHIRSHTGEKPYQCLFCGKGFTQKPNMKIHMRIHTGEKPYYCTVCSKPFPSKQQVTVHMTCHTG